MFYYIQGIVAHVAPYLAVLDCSGVGYACKTTNHTLAALTRGKSAKLYTHLYVREEIMELYGFISESELNCFEMLIGVSGVGPKAALAILSSNGKKIAQRIILELKDKLAKGQLTVSGGEAFAGGMTIIPEDKTSEAAAALAVLGYSQQEIGLAFKGLDMEGLTLEEIIKQALKKMVK